MYQVGVVGLGSIAAMYETPEDDEPYCHVGGIRESESVELRAVADLSADARDRFRDVWGEAFPGLSYHDSAESMVTDEQLDVVAVCVRGPHHHEVTQTVLSADPDAVFLEKPPTCSLAELDDLIETADDHDIPITVSYSRHWAPKVLRLEELVEDGVIGDVEQVVSYAGGGVLSFASHATDLLFQFGGDSADSVSATGTVPEPDDLPDGYDPEPALDSMVVEFENGVTGIQVGNSGEHGTFYCDVFGTDGSVRAGLYTDPVVRDDDGERVDADRFDFPEPQSVFTVAYDQVADYLDGGDRPACTGDDFVRVHEVGFGAIESIYTGRRVDLPNVDRERRVFANG